MAGLGKQPPLIQTTPRALLRQAGVQPAMPTPMNINPAPRIKPTAPSMRNYGKNPLANPANLGQVR